MVLAQLGRYSRDADKKHGQRASSHSKPVYIIIIYSHSINPRLQETKE
jgi:hypothetical protein